MLYDTTLLSYSIFWCVCTLEHVCVYVLFPFANLNMRVRVDVISDYIVLYIVFYTVL